MLAEKNRLRKKKDFDAVWQKGRPSFDKLTGLKALANGLQENRFGIMVGLKFSKKAVERNQIKRRIREIIRAQAEDLRKGFDVVITVLPAARGKEYSELEGSLALNLKRLKLWVNSGAK